MTTLRLHVRAADATSALQWALFDDDGALLRTGRDAPSDLPRADTLEIVVAAADVRLASLALPPMPAPRVAAAAAFALEDRLAGPADDQWLAPAAQRHNGRVIVAIVSRALLTSLRARAATIQATPAARILVEPELAGVGTGWRWCVPDTELELDGQTAGSFVRAADGSAFPVSPIGADDTLPPELQLALAQTLREGPRPSEIRVDANVADATLARWQGETGVPFVRGAPWRWFDADPATFAAATNLLQRELAPTPPPPPGSKLRAFKVALVLAGIALVLQVTATIGEWAWWRVADWRTTRATIAIATEAGVPAANAATAKTALAGLAKRYADERHTRGLTAPEDALPLLARAAPALSGLAATPGVLKSATYADGHWTLDLQGGNPQVVRGIEAKLKESGTPAIVAQSQTGVRVRIGALR